MKWKEIPGYERHYEVSDDGQVRSSRCVLKQFPKDSGHLTVSLSLAGRVKTRTVHQLVMQAFVGPPPEGLEVCHEDGDPTNNRLSNLRYDTHAANQRDMLRHGTHNCARKTECKHGHKYTAENTYYAKQKTGRPRRRCRTCTLVGERHRRVA